MIFVTVKIVDKWSLVAAVRYSFRLLVDEGAYQTCQNIENNTNKSEDTCGMLGNEHWSFQDCKDLSIPPNWIKAKLLYV